MTSSRQAQVVICGAGIAGISSAYYLAAREGISDVLLLDMDSPLSLTSDQSTECYRNWWPGPGDAMVRFMNRSIDLMEELAQRSNNVFQLNRRGYLYCSSDPAQLPAILRDAQEISRLGAGPVRVYERKGDHGTYLPADSEDFFHQPTGADLLLDREMIRQTFPFLADDICAVLHARRAGWLSAQQLGMYLLEQARQRGVRFINERVTGIEILPGGEFRVTTASGDQIITATFVDAAGPFVKPVAEMLGVDLPVKHELHLKVNFKDSLAVLPRSAPLVIYTGPQTLQWSDEERRELEADPDYRFLLDEMPSGVHTRPEGGPGSQMILVLWEYDNAAVEPAWPVPVDPFYAEIAVRGLGRLIPGMRQYSGKFTRPVVDGGYYTKTPENRPLIGPLPVPGAYVIGALSGFGIMASCAAGELLSKHIAGSELPDYAPAFELERYQRPDYLELLNNWGNSGQL